MTSGESERLGWAGRLRTLGRRGLERNGSCGVLLDVIDGADVEAGARAGFVAGFRDERGHRRLTDGLVLARLCAVESTGVGAGGGNGVGADVVLFEGLVRGDASAVDGVIAATGPVIPFDPEIGIERWTQGELGALHALGIWASRGVGVGRVIDAARWHVEELQPDNATNHAWALHAFVALAALGEGDGLLHAQTLMHNAMVAGGGVPDVVSSVLMVDAALALEGDGWDG